jgi:hypothetical protein
MLFLNAGVSAIAYSLSHVSSLNWWRRRATSIVICSRHLQTIAGSDVWPGWETLEISCGAFLLISSYMGTIYLSCNLQEIRAAMQLDPSRLQIQSSKDEWMLCESLGERELRLAHAVPVIKHSQTSWHQPSPASLSWWHLVTSLADSYRTAETTGTWEESGCRYSGGLPRMWRCQQLIDSACASPYGVPENRLQALDDQPNSIEFE